MKRDVGVVQSMIEGLDNAYSMMGTHSEGDGIYVMRLQASSFMFRELVSLLADLMVMGHVLSMSLLPWEDKN